MSVKIRLAGALFGLALVALHLFKSGSATPGAWAGLVSATAFILSALIAEDES